MGLIFGFARFMRAQKEINNQLDDLLSNEYNNITRAIQAGDFDRAKQLLFTFHKRYKEIIIEAQNKVESYQLGNLMLLWGDGKLYKWQDWNMLVMRYINDVCCVIGIPPLVQANGNGSFYF